MLFSEIISKEWLSLNASPELNSFNLLPFIDPRCYKEKRDLTKQAGRGLSGEEKELQANAAPSREAAAGEKEVWSCSFPCLLTPLTSAALVHSPPHCTTHLHLHPLVCAFCLLALWAEMGLSARLGFEVLLVISQAEQRTCSHLWRGGEVGGEGGSRPITPPGSEGWEWVGGWVGSSVGAGGGT